MRSEHRGPLVASIVVVLACVGVMVHAVRTDALGGIGARLPMGMVAASALHPKAERAEDPVASGAQESPDASTRARPHAESRATLTATPERDGHRSVGRAILAVDDAGPGIAGQVGDETDPSLTAEPEGEPVRTDETDRSVLAPELRTPIPGTKEPGTTEPGTKESGARWPGTKWPTSKGASGKGASTKGASGKGSGTKGSGTNQGGGPGADSGASSAKAKGSKTLDLVANALGTVVKSAVRGATPPGLGGGTDGSKPGLGNPGPGNAGPGNPGPGTAGHGNPGPGAAGPGNPGPGTGAQGDPGRGSGRPGAGGGRDDDRRLGWGAWGRDGNDHRGRR